MINRVFVRTHKTPGRIIFLAAMICCVSSAWATGAEIAGDELARLIYTGRFTEAKKTLTTQPVGTVNQPANPLASQLNGFMKVLDEQEKIRVENYDRNVKEARNYLAKAEGKAPAGKPTTRSARTTVKKATTQSTRPGFDAEGNKRKETKADAEAPKTNIEKALTAARKARFYAVDQKQFGQLDFVRRIADKAKVQAKEYMDRHEWLRAGNIYAELATLYEDDKTYDKLTRDCAMRVRFEAVYKPKVDWKDQIKNIKIDVIPELAYNIANYYVEKPDFSKMITTGLQSVGMITEIPKLTKVFPSLSDGEKTRAFDAEIKKLLEQVKADEAKKNLSTREFYQAFIKLLVINDDTIGLPQELIIKEFTDAALGELDPFTNLIWPAELDDFDKQTTGRFSGVGIQLSMENNKLKVITPIPGTPAYRAGIVPGDLIVTINGETTEGITIDQAVRKITGPKGTKVTLGILHPWSDAVRETPMIRDTIIIQTVKGFRLDKDNEWQFLMDPPNEKIAYVRVTSFTETTAEELEAALKIIRKQGAQGLILDLRFNPGGTLKGAYETADLFIGKGTLVSTKGRSVESWTQSANPGTKYTDIPMIVLINNFSASAAEIVSGALKDYHRAWVVGERSFGKGSVQNVLPLVNETARLKMTTAHYYLPKGKCIHKKPDSKEWGVDPDLKLELNPSELRDVVDLEREAEIVKQINGVKVTSKPTTTQSAPTASGPAEDESMPDEDEEKLPPTKSENPQDVQLQAAALIMKAHLAFKLPWDKATEIPPAATQPVMVKTTR